MSRFAVAVVAVGVGLAWGRPAPADPVRPSPVRLGPDDLSPVFAGTPVEPALERVRARDWAGARDALLATSKGGRPPEHAERVRFLLGLACVNASDWMCAQAVLDGLDRDVPAVADRILFLRGTALDALGRTDEALAAFGAVGRKSAVGVAALRAKADLLERAGRPDEAAAALREVVDAGRRDPETVGRLAASLAESGRKADAVAVLRRAYFESASAGRSALRKVLEGLGVSAAPTPSEALDHARALLDAHASEDALREARTLQSSSDRDVRCGALVVEGGALTKLRRHGDALAAFRRALACGDAVDLARVLFNALRAAYRADERAEGDRYAARLANEFPRSTLNDDAAVIRARSAMSRDAETRAIAILEESLRRWPDGDMAAESRWVVAWSLFRRNKTALALPRLRAGLEAAGDDVAYGSRFQYWTGRALDALGKHDEAVRAYEACVRRYPMSFYGFLALGRLAEARRTTVGNALRQSAGGANPPPAEYLTVEDPGLLREGGLGRALWLLASGLPDLAAEEVDVSADPPSPGGAWLAAAILDAGGLHTRAHRAAAALLLDGSRFWPGPGTVGYWKLAYPRPFASVVAGASRESDVEPALVWAVMREESAFVAGIESHANAIGLMQLILPTARAMAAKLSLEATPRTLRRPEVNVRLGTRYLADLLKQFNEPLLAIPGYNAGGGAIARWRKAHPTAPLDVFVEEIGAQETRDYARKVFESYAIYRLLYGDGPDRYVHVRFAPAAKEKIPPKPKKKPVRKKL
jgi:soluble lytic murein transglycosylase